MIEDLASFMEKHPHNTYCSDKFYSLVYLAYQNDKTGKTLEEFVEYCLSLYGGTIAGAMIDYLINNSRR